jgi:hypothetical protein
MNLLKLKLKFIVLALVFFSALAAPFALAAEVTEEESPGLPFTIIPTEEQNKTLAEKFRTGNFELYDLPKYVIYLIEFLIYIAGGISVLFVVIGGYKYMIGGTTDDKEAGKKTIGYALGGFAVSVLAWTIVNFIQVWLTSG